MAKSSDLILDVSVEKEACPNNLAPTTSTTMQLVMGDAIAISLLKIKNFSKEDFAKYHPAGSLGKKLNMEVSDLCNQSNPPKVLVDDRLDKIIFEYIEVFYNRKRLHSANGYMSPMSYEQRLVA